MENRMKDKMRSFAGGWARRIARRLEPGVDPVLPVQTQEPKAKPRPKYPDSALVVREKLSLGVEYAYAADVQGDIAEFGTAWGVTASALAETMANVDSDIRFRVDRPKTLHLFDSFEGLPRVENEVDAQSPHVQSGLWGPGTCGGVTKAKLVGMCAEYLAEARIRTHEGWFSDTLPKVSSDTRFALMHIDCDLYESTVDVLDHCFSRGFVSEGAALFFDDWACNRSMRELGEQRAWSEAVQRYGIEASDCGEYGLMSRKFIVHAYRGMPRTETLESAT